MRIAHAIARMRTILDQVEKTLDVDAPPGPDVGQAVAHSGADIACSLASLSAYMRAERRCGNVLKGDGGEEYVCALHPEHVNGPESDHTDDMGLAQWPSVVHGT